METRRTFGLNKNVGFLPAAMLVFVGGIIEYYVFKIIVDNVLRDMLNTTDAYISNLIVSLVDIALVAGIFVVLLYLAASTLKSKRYGFILGAMAGMAITVADTFDYYTSISEYLIANLLLLGGLEVLVCGAIGAAFVYLAYHLMPAGSSAGGKSYLKPFVIFLGLGYLIEAAFFIVMMNAGNPQPAPYVNWVIQGILILVCAYVLRRIYRSIPDVPAMAAPTASDAGSPAFDTPAPVIQSASAAQSAPAAISIPVRVRTAAPAATTPVAPPVAAPPVQPAPAPVADHLFCDNCGIENKIGARFCAQCGNKLE